jgi:lipopolysaccharide assembly protein A
MVRSAVTACLLICGFAIAAIFAALNPGRIHLDLAFAAVDVDQSIALMAAVGLGWFLGLLSAGFAVLRLVQQRRSLRRGLRLAEQEVQALRSIPVQDAE